MAAVRAGRNNFAGLVRPRTAAARGRLAVTLPGAIGGVFAVIGASSPWLSFFGGLVPLAGTDGLSGQLALALGVASTLAALTYGLTGSTVARWAVGLGGAALLAVGGIAAINLAAALPGLQADPLTASRPEPGIVVLLAGAGSVFSTFFVGPAAGLPAPDRLLGLLRAHAGHALVLALAFAGLVHLSLGPEHLAVSTVIGGGMLAGGVAQLLLAAAVARGGATRLLSFSVVTLSIALLAAWVIAVTVGLPAQTHSHLGVTSLSDHGVGGHVEPVGVIGIATAVAELAALGLVRFLPRTSASA